MRTSAFQQDIFQRYSLLARLLVAAFPEAAGAPVTILDIGSGPGRLTETFLPSYFKVTRADVSTFGDDAVVELHPGQGLPFDDSAFSVVIALEVLEHVPAPDRAALITECARVGSSLVVLSCPVAAPLTGQAEDVFQALAAEMSGQPVAFLDEHKTEGLPDATAVHAALADRMSHVVQIPNSPLPEWLLYNLIDLAYACDFGDAEEKAAFNSHVNRTTPLRRAGDHYRRFFIGCRSRTACDRIEAAVPEPSPDADGGFATAVTAAQAIVEFRRLLLKKHADGMRDALGAKDAHIRKLEEIITRLEREAAPVDESAKKPAETARHDSSAADERRAPAALHRARGRLRTLRIGKGVPAAQRTLVAESGLFDEAFYRAQSPDVVASGVDPLVHYLAIGGVEGRNPNPLFDTAYYLAGAPDVRAAGINPLVHYLTGGAAEGRQPHPLFDSTFYLAHHSEAADAGKTPLAHYLATGARTRWDPSPLFWAGYYLDANPDVRASGANPLVHYVQIGAKEGRNPNPLFDAAFYRGGDADAVAAGVDGLLHYLHEGAMQGRNPHPLFWSEYYLATYPDVATAGVNPLVHYLLHGASEGRSPNPLFDAALYLAESGSDVLANGNPLAHYVTTGAAAGRRAHVLFDARFYVDEHPELGGNAAGALEHYLATGAQTRWNPHPLFWGAYYLDRNPDVAATGTNPLVHYVLYGAHEGRNPNPLFDGAYYLARHPEVAAKGVNPLVHYIESGAAEGRKPSALFDGTYYLSANPDVAAAGVNPLAHYLTYGRGERRPPNKLFDPHYYLQRNPDVAAAGADPLFHFVDHGAAEGRDPSPGFETSYYLRENADVAAARLNPLAHYLDHGEAEGRIPLPPSSSLAPYVPSRFVPPVGLLPWFSPLNLRLSPSLDDAPSLNVLVPGLAMKHMSGGPNTALHIAYRLALGGVRVRFISTDAPLADRDALYAHVQSLAGSRERLPNVEFADGHDRRHVLAIGHNDLFFATAWWTAQMAKFACDLTRSQRFVYLIQDYEPLFHAASTPQALAIETYSLDCLPIVNSHVLFDFLRQNRVGRFSDPAFADNALVFEPAVDRTRFFVEAPVPDRPRRLLFYTRPTTGLRNLFELGVAALMEAAERGTFAGQPWELLAMGEAIEPRDLGHGLTLKPAPWLDFDGYAAQMRQSDVLLSLMLSPHPSYPPLEMAACGGLVVTNTFDCKTAERLAAMSANIIGAEPTFESVAEALSTAVHGVADPVSREAGASLELPSTWADSLVPVVERLHPLLLHELGVAAEPRGGGAPGRRLPAGFDSWPRNRYELYRIDRLRERRALYPAERTPGLLSFATAVWNTDPAMLQTLADSILNQEPSENFEWVILDNGSDREETLQILERLRTDPCVRLTRLAENGGIVRGLRSCIEAARNRYVVFVDHDDFVAPDAVRVLSSSLRSHGYPALFYTDEEKVSELGHYHSAYFKPDWDPVLFVNSCFIAHLCGVDRNLALALSCCDDPLSEGSHDWDTFMRFVIAGHVPRHVPEVLYTWRAHQGSTAANIHSKPYVFDSQKHVLSKFISAQAESSRFGVEQSPLFDNSSDWWIRRARTEGKPVTTVVWSSGDGPAGNGARPDDAVPRDVIRIGGDDPLTELRDIARDCRGKDHLVHLLWEAVDVDDPDWVWEARGLLELFPDTVMIGGRLHDGRRLLSAGQFFGFGEGCGSPDKGRLLHDPGYFAQLWKSRSVSAVSAQHAVVDARFLEEALDGLRGLPVTMMHLGAWLGAAARRAGRRVVYSPFLSGRVPRDGDSDISPIEHGAFRVVNRDLMPEPHLLSPHLGLTEATAYLPVSDGQRRRELKEGCPTLLEYHDWLSARIVARRRVYPLREGAPGMSILTTVYSGTPAPLFEALADSVHAQTRPAAEWIVLAHGAISPELDATLSSLEHSRRARVLRLPENLGIVGGMRECLLAARGEYVLPVDADDVLTVDALQVMASAIGAQPSPPRLVYSDEDIWRQGPQSPFARPDFDPVLNLETSYVWHLCAIRRDAALECGLYTDPLMEYCHDWDTIMRLAAIEEPVHVREVLYHWRHHAVSHTNRLEQHPGTSKSTRHLLGGRVAALDRPSLFEVAEFPIFRGAHEWYIRRKPIEPPPVALLLTGPEALTSIRRRDFAVTGFPFVTIESAPDAAGIGRALRALRDIGARYLAIVAEDAEPEGLAWLWEAIRLCECHPSIGLCGGRLLNAEKRIVKACTVLEPDGDLTDPFVGLGAADPGSFALALKPHLVAAVPAELCVIAADLLAIDAVVDAVANDQALRLSAETWAHGRTVAYSPLIEARTHAATKADSDTAPELTKLRRALRGRQYGAAGFVGMRREHRG